MVYELEIKRALNKRIQPDADFLILLQLRSGILRKVLWDSRLPTQVMEFTEAVESDRVHLCAGAIAKADLPSGHLELSLCSVTHTLKESFARV